MATGDQSGTWGDTTNTNLGTLLEQAITGVLSKAMGDADVTLSNIDGATDEARNAVILLTGANTAVRKVIVPSGAGRNKLYLVNNQTSGGFAVNVITSGGTGVLVVAGSSQLVYCDGTNVNQGLAGSMATQAASAVAITGGTITGLSAPLPVASGGTGTTSGFVTTVRVQTFTASGTYTPNANMIYCTIYACGGGGGGGGAQGSGGVRYGGGGGSGAATAVKTVLKATIGASQAVAIGARGAAGASNNGQGGAGGSTSVGSICIGTGGLGSAAQVSGSAPGVAGATTGTGDFILAGGSSSASWSGTSGVGGDGGSAYFGAGGVGGFQGAVNAVSGNPGTGFGSGGSGGSQGNSSFVAPGGAGAPGYVVIIEQCSA